MNPGAAGGPVCPADLHATEPAGAGRPDRPAQCSL